MISAGAAKPIAGPQGLPILGHLLEYRKDPARFLLRTSRQYGDLVAYWVGPQKIYLLNRPDYIQQVLVTQAGNFHKSPLLQRAKILLGEGLLTSEDEFHLRQRRMIQPAFHRERLASYARVMAAKAETSQARWQHGETRDMAAEMMRLTLAIVGETLFSSDVESDAQQVTQALTDVHGVFGTLMLPFSSLLQKLPFPVYRRARRGRLELDRTIYALIRSRRTSGRDHGDLLSMLLLAQDQEGSGGMAPAVMTDKQVRDEALTLFLAGHETTAHALTWTLYLLSQNNDVASALRSELKTVLGSRSPAMEDIPQLRYTTMVFSEALRLYPPAWAVSRLVLADFDLDGHRIERGSICLMSPYVMHRNPEFYPDPERFDPARWEPAQQALRPRFSFFPFGGGARVCIGERFAWMEGVLALAAMARNWHWVLDPAQVVDIHPVITLRPRFGMRMRLERVN